jgi:hypothetical protein
LRNAWKQKEERNESEKSKMATTQVSFICLKIARRDFLAGVAWKILSEYKKSLSECRQTFVRTMTKVCPNAGKRLSKRWKSLSECRQTFVRMQKKVCPNAGKRLSECRQKFVRMQTKVCPNADKRLSECRQTFVRMQTKVCPNAACASQKNKMKPSPDGVA